METSNKTQQVKSTGRKLPPPPENYFDNHHAIESLLSNVFKVTLALPDKVGISNDSQNTFVVLPLEKLRICLRLEPTIKNSRDFLKSFEGPQKRSVVSSSTDIEHFAFDLWSQIFKTLLIDVTLTNSLPNSSKFNSVSPPNLENSTLNSSTQQPQQQQQQQHGLSYYYKSKFVLTERLDSSSSLKLHHGQIDVHHQQILFYISFQIPLELIGPFLNVEISLPSMQFSNYILRTLADCDDSKTHFEQIIPYISARGYLDYRLILGCICKPISILDALKITSRSKFISNRSLIQCSVENVCDRCIILQSVEFNVLTWTISKGISDIDAARKLTPSISDHFASSTTDLNQLASTTTTTTTTTTHQQSVSAAITSTIPSNNNGVSLMERNNRSSSNVVIPRSSSSSSSTVALQQLQPSISTEKLPFSMSYDGHLTKFPLDLHDKECYSFVINCVPDSSHIMLSEAASKFPTPYVEFATVLVFNYGIKGEKTTFTTRHIVKWNYPNERGLLLSMSLQQYPVYSGETFPVNVVIKNFEARDYDIVLSVDDNQFSSALLCEEAVVHVGLVRKYQTTKLALKYYAVRNGLFDLFPIKIFDKLTGTLSICHSPQRVQVFSRTPLDVEMIDVIENKLESTGIGQENISSRNLNGDTDLSVIVKPSDAIDYGGTPHQPLDINNNNNNNNNNNIDNNIDNIDNNNNNIDNNNNNNNNNATDCSIVNLSSASLEESFITKEDDFNKLDSRDLKKIKKSVNAMDQVTLNASSTELGLLGVVDQQSATINTADSSESERFQLLHANSSVDSQTLTIKQHPQQQLIQKDRKMSNPTAIITGPPTPISSTPNSGKASRKLSIDVGLKNMALSVLRHTTNRKSLRGTTQTNSSNAGGNGEQMDDVSDVELDSPRFSRDDDEEESTSSNKT